MVNRYDAPASRLDVKPELWSIPTWAHPEYKYFYSDWRRIRDAAEGEKEVKAEAATYLPILDGMDNIDYKEYLGLATYFNFTGKTLGALKGTLFRREVEMEGFPERLTHLLHKITKRNQDVTYLLTKIGEETIAMNRVGVLVDLPDGITTEPEPYMAIYTAEHIIDWEEEEINGRIVPTMVVLREVVTGRDTGGRYYPVRRARPRYRVLRLSAVEGVSVTPIYYQQIYENIPPAVSPIGTAWIDVDLTKEPSRTVFPTVRGQYLDYIPFVMFSTEGDVLTVQKPGLQDIAALNMSHYRSYAALEQARFYTGNPVYYAESQGDDAVEYTLGPKRVWLVPPGTRPGIIEFNGHGLRFLEQALPQKESQAAAIGGRLIGILTQAVAETDNQTEMKNRNEVSFLLTISQALDASLRKLFLIFLDFANATEAEREAFKIALNKDFLVEGGGSREFRAILAMYKDGAIPVQILYQYLKREEIVPAKMTEAQFVNLLNSETSFPNQADLRARLKGYSSALAEQNEALKNRELDIDEEEVEVKRKVAERPAPTPSQRSTLIEDPPAE